MPTTETITPKDIPSLFRATAEQLKRMDLRTAFKVIRQLVIADTKMNFAAGRSPDGATWRPLKHPRPRGGDKLLRDRGLLMASVTANGAGHYEKFTATGFEYGTNLIYAPLHQYGGVITPKKGKFLAIPLTRQAVTAGSPRSFSGQLVPIFGKRGGVLAEPAKKGKRGTAHYALVKRVTVPARPFLGWSQALLKKVDGVFQAMLARALGGEKNG